MGFPLGFNLPDSSTGTIESTVYERGSSPEDGANRIENEWIRYTRPFAEKKSLRSYHVRCRRAPVAVPRGEPRGSRGRRRSRRNRSPKRRGKIVITRIVADTNRPGVVVLLSAPILLMSHARRHPGHFSKVSARYERIT